MSTTLKALQRIEQGRSQQRNVNRSMATLPVRLGIGARPNQIFHWLRVGNWRLRWVLVAAAFGASVCLILVVPGIQQRPDMAPFASVPALVLDSMAEKSGSPLQPNGAKDSSVARPATSHPSTSIQLAAAGPETLPKGNPGGHTASLVEKAKPWNGDGLKVQAIVFGMDPRTCMALINGRMVHQGDLVDGFAVAAIEQDAVIVSQGRDRWRLPLGR